MQDPFLLDAARRAPIPATPFRLGRLDVQSQLVRLIAAQGGIGRADIARLTGMARSTVSEHLQPLLDSALLAEQRASYAGRGRPSAGLSLNAAAGVVLVADIGITHGRLVVADLARHKLAEDAFTPDIAAGPEAVLGEVVRRFRALAEAGEWGGARIRTLVVGIASPVDFERGVPVRPPIMPGWDGFPAADWLRERLAMPVLIDNDVNLMALGEARSRPLGRSPLLFVKVASGIGCGIVTHDGELHRGADGDAGDIGHISVAAGAGVPCPCGNVGCIEAIASAPAITRQLQAQRGAADAVDLAALMAAGDSLAVRLVREAAAEIGEVVATLVNMFNPASIVLGGKVAHMSDDLLSGVRAAVYRRAPPLATRRLSIENSRLAGEAGVVGGIALGVDRALSPAGVQGLLGAA
jgi:predicted NBD/HSP70 family sugar kinase